MAHPKTLAKPFVRVLLKANARRGISTLRSSGEVARLLADALAETFQHEVTAEEDVWLSRLDCLRSDLESDARSAAVPGLEGQNTSIGCTSTGTSYDIVMNRTIGEIYRGASVSPL